MTIGLSKAEVSVTACGRKQPLTGRQIPLFERPLLVKTDTQNPVCEKWWLNDRYTSESSRSPDMMLNDCY